MRPTVHQKSTSRTTGSPGGIMTTFWAAETSELPTKVKDIKICTNVAVLYTVKSPIYISHKIKIMYNYPSQNMLQAEVSAIKLFYYQQILFSPKKHCCYQPDFRKKKSQYKHS